MKLYHCLAISLMLHGIAFLSLSSYDYKKTGDVGRQVYVRIRHDNLPALPTRELGGAITSGADIPPDEAVREMQPAASQFQHAGSPVEEVVSYIHTKELDINPVPLNDIDIDVFNHEAIKDDVSAILVIYISSYGLVDRVEIETSSIPSEYLEKIIEIFKKSRFSPGVKNGNAVNSQIRIKVGLET